MNRLERGSEKREKRGKGSRDERSNGSANGIPHSTTGIELRSLYTVTIKWFNSWSHTKIAEPHKPIPGSIGKKS